MQYKNECESFLENGRWFELWFIGAYYKISIGLQVYFLDDI
jgi:hypothetical protein